MHYHFSFYSSILLIFFTQGIIFTFLLVKRGISELDKSSVLLGFFTFLCSLYILPWMLGHAGWYSLQPYRDIMFYLPLQQLFLIGPVIYFYTKSLLYPSFKFKLKDFLHLIPFCLYSIYSLIVYVTDKLVLHQYYFYSNGRDKDLDPWYQISGLVSMIIYFLLSIKTYNQYKKMIFDNLSFADLVLFDWIKKYLIAFLGMQFLRIIFFLVFPGWGNFIQNWWYFLLFSALFYYVAISSLLQKGIKVSAYNLKHFESIIKNPVTIEPVESSNVIVTSKVILDKTNDQNYIDPTVLELWKNKIETFIESQKLFQNPLLNLNDVASGLQTHPTQISRMINQGFKMNFNDFINNYRIEAVKEMLKKNEQKRKTLLGIAYESGFNSKTTFNRSFKKNTNTSPKKYIEEMERSKNLNQN